LIERDYDTDLLDSTEYLVVAYLVKIFPCVERKLTCHYKLRKAPPMWLALIQRYSLF